MPPDPPKTQPTENDLEIADLLAGMGVPTAEPPRPPDSADLGRGLRPSRPEPAPVAPEEPRTVPVRRNSAPPARPLFEESELVETPEPFLNPNASRVAIVGGKQTGKSYLFQSIVHRCQSGVAAGALAPWLTGEGMRIFTTRSLTDNQREMNRARFLEAYRRWTRLDQTLEGTQRWYKLRLGLRRGLLGAGRLPLEVEFFDASGEMLEAETNDITRPIWSHFARAPVVVFCLPMWVAFPNWQTRPTRAQADDWYRRLAGFAQLVVNLRAARGSRGSVRTVLALTMADDRRVALQAVKERWIRAVIDDPERHLGQLRKQGGLARYLDNARVVSEIVLRELERSPWDDVKAIAQGLDFGAGAPWIVPMSAMDGERLTRIEHDYPDPDDRLATLRPPIPAHVELPLLVGLCDRFNALM